MKATKIVWKILKPNKFNIITFPKHGCTQIIKYVSEINGYFKNHNHSYFTNNCNQFGHIHNCGKKNFSYNQDLPTYIITRLPEYKILSYYLSNYCTVIHLFFYFWWTNIFWLFLWNNRSSNFNNYRFLYLVNILGKSKYRHRRA